MNESCVSLNTDCFLDDLMDKDMINVDFNFGDLTTEEGPLLTKGSPSHESDSGISASSPAYSLTSSMEDESVFDNFSGTNINIDQFEDFDEELASYLNATRKIKEKESKNIYTSDVCSPLLVTPASSPISGLLDDVLNEPVASPPVIEIPETLKSNIQTRSSIRLKNEKPSTSQPKQKANQQAPAVKKFKPVETEPSQLPAVKVIKVISAPSNQSKIDTEKQIYDAIDERNRKNAIQAKINREKKKSYIKSLETEVEELKEENWALKDGKNKMEQTVRILEEEVQYLKSVIANDSALSNLLKNIPKLNNVRLTSSFSQRKRAASHDHDYQSNIKHPRTQAGVCLHVKNDTASLEFCSKCSLMSQSDSEGES